MIIRFFFSFSEKFIYLIMIEDVTPPPRLRRKESATFFHFFFSFLLTCCGNQFCSPVLCNQFCLPASFELFKNCFLVNCRTRHSIAITLIVIKIKDGQTQFFGHQLMAFSWMVFFIPIFKVLYQDESIFFHLWVQSLNTGEIISETTEIRIEYFLVKGSGSQKISCWA